MSVLTAFASHCRTNAYALWAGTWDYYAFMDAMIPEIENGYQAAWREALAAHDMELEDATEEEERYVADAQAQASSHLNDLGEWIELHARDGEEPLLLAAIHGRIDLWVNDLQRLITWANTELAGNEKLEWVLGATEQHCPDCAKYAGRVYRARAWARVGALPQSRELACGGWQCDCDLVSTTKRPNKGFPPRPTGRMHELAEWDDALHPRDENGRFVSGGGEFSGSGALGGRGGSKATDAQIKKLKTISQRLSGHEAEALSRDPHVQIMGKREIFGQAFVDVNLGEHTTGNAETYIVLQVETGEKLRAAARRWIENDSTFEGLSKEDADALRNSIEEKGVTRTFVSAFGGTTPEERVAFMNKVNPDIEFEIRTRTLRSGREKTEIFIKDEYFAKERSLEKLEAPPKPSIAPPHPAGAEELPASQCEVRAANDYEELSKPLADGFNRSRTCEGIAQSAKQLISSGDANGITLNNQYDEITAIAAYDDDDNLRPGDYVYVEYVASGIRGGGTRLMAAICREASKLGKGVSLSALDTAESFYEKIGMSRINDGKYHYPGSLHDYHFTPSQTKWFADMILGEK